ncbi:hypothetical protein ONE63_011227 [Megalurothrips usitatus]|uniref:Gustatory receptor n=1 Tax=Megalurothrips usitatus TaxID=439358 RepID=A0AAV7X691_9NEOP|nr:hypothetical protein ONE63_011227 [Megalurothrips usitatus]
MAATVAVWVFLVVVGYFTVRVRIGLVSDGTKYYHIWDMVPRYATAFALSYIFVLPFTCWTTAHRAIAFIQYWTAFEAEMQSLLEANVSLAGLRRSAWWFTALAVGLPVCLQATALAVLPDESTWSMPVLLHSLIFMTLGTAFWLLCCQTFARVATFQAARLPSDFKRMGMTGLRAHRRIWHGMARTLDLMAASWGRTQMLLLAISFVAITCISFVVVHIIVVKGWSSQATWLGFVWVFSAAGICTICNGAHIASTGVTVISITGAWFSPYMRG